MDALVQHPHVPYFLAGLGLVILLKGYVPQLGRKRLPLPPGPKPLPLIGNLLELPTEKEWLTYKSWSDQYGDVVYAEALGNKIIVLGSMEVVTDLLDRRSTIYSDRFELPMLTHLMDFGWVLAGIPYGERWRKTRKVLHQQLHAGVSPQYQPLQLKGAREFCEQLLEAMPAPEVLPALVRSSFGTTIVQMVYGIDIKNEAARQEYIDNADNALAAANLAFIPGRFLVDFFPWMRYIPAWMPGAGFQRFARETRELHERLRFEPMKLVEDDIAAGTGEPCMVRTMLEKVAPDDAATKRIIANAAGATYLAGADTTVASVVAFFLAMLLYPEVQKKGQLEVDSVTGGKRLPDFADSPQLPYVNAIVLEALRWLPVAPMGIAHSTSEDDEYKGYFIPKGTIILPAAWAILQNPEMFPDPEQFKPERFLLETPNGYTLNPAVLDPRTVAFGFGRRICPGRHLSEASLFSTVVSVLATLNVVRALDDNGKEITPIIDVTSGSLSHPKPFPYRVQARSSHTAAMLANKE